MEDSIKTHATPDVVQKYRVNLSLPADLATGISRLAKRMGITQSALVTVLLSEAVPDLETLIQSIPENPSPDAIKRFRGQSIDYVFEAVKTALKEM